MWWHRHGLVHTLTLRLLNLVHTVKVRLLNSTECIVCAVIYHIVSPHLLLIHQSLFFADLKSSCHGLSANGDFVRPILHAMY